MQKRFSWDDVQVLLSLWRARSLSGAATLLSVNASTAGRRLDALELALGVRLFDRTPDGVLPTAAAERLIPHAEQFEHAAVGFAGAAGGFESDPEGVVRISAPPGVADHFVAPALPRLLARYPALRIELDASVGYADLSRREADLALRASRPTSGDLVSVKIADEEDALLASADYVKKAGTVRALDELDWIGWGADLAHIPSARWLAEAVPDARVLFRSSSMTAQLGAARAGIGAVILPRIFARFHPLDELRISPKLAVALPPLPRETLFLVGHRALREVPRIAVVWKFIVEELDGGSNGARK